MDAVYLFGGNTDGAELRHSLRSIGNLRQVDRVAVSGLHPGWLSDRVLRITPDTHGPSKHASTWANLRAACADRRLSDEIVLMNDDFFTLAPVDAIPVWHAGVLSRTVVRNKYQDKRRDLTLDMLATLGAPGRLSYELHLPMVVHRHLMAGLMREVEARLPARSDPVWKRTLYGNVAHPGVGERRPDVKVRGFVETPDSGQVFLSTSDYTWKRGAVGQWLRARFAEPSPFER